MARSALILGSIAGMKLCPPKPGFTVMTSTRSVRSSTHSTICGGVPGSSATPARRPRSRIVCSVRSRCGPASGCTVRMSAPASAKALRYGSAGAIIRWTSSTVLTCGRIACTNCGPKVMLGTKCPSMTSTCTQSAPCCSIARHSAPKAAKSADRIEGAIRIRRSKLIPALLGQTPPDCKRLSRRIPKRGAVASSVRRRICGTACARPARRSRNRRPPAHSRDSARRPGGNSDR